ncbi:MAG: T9SS type A sorting domain-containing protein [Bacteroidetes bacterium]|nr:T9SS type A sorting domain-containing protein [Bacteroidota bacterium]
MKKSIFLIVLWLLTITNLILAQCPTPSIITLVKDPGALIVHSTSGIDGTYYAEYGASGFTPGTNSTAGPGGTLVSSSFDGMNIISPSSSLATYDVYVRVLCSNGTWTANSQPYTSNHSMSVGPTLYPSLIHLGVSQGLVLNSPIWPGDMQSTCYFGFPTGSEMRFRFDNADNTDYELIQRVPSSSPVPLVGIKELDTIFAPSSYNCLNVSYSVNEGSFTKYYYQTGPLVPGESYDIIFDAQDLTQVNSSFFINCPAPINITKSNITPTSIDIGWSCNCSDSIIIEHGFSGFIPGLELQPGTNGTVAITNASSHTISGLIPFTEYDVYIRTVCGGNFTVNKKYKMKSAKNCNLFTQLNCGDYNQFDYDGLFALRGAWDLGGADSSEEQVFTFIPSQTGMYSMHFYDLFANAYNYTYSVNTYFKPVNSGCNEQGWSFIGNILASPPAFNDTTLTFGPLTAGVTYYIALDGKSFGSTQSYRYSFQLQCSNICYIPLLNSPSNVSPTAATINVACSNCFTNGIIEYGPSGFVPGAGGNPGAGGTIVYPTTFPYTISGLSPYTSYDVYMRSDCTGSGLGFSANNGPKTFFTCSSPPLSISTSTGNSNSNCTGDSITLYRVGGELAPGSQFVWYSGSCGGTMIGTGDSIIVAPLSTTAYFVRAESQCGNSICVTKSIIPLYQNLQITGIDTICIGQTTTLAGNTSWPSYTWSTGANTSSISVGTAGTYYLMVNAPNGCTDSDSITVVTLPAALPVITGDPDICPGASTILDAGAGYTNYLWSNGITSQTLTTASPGNYTVTVTDAFGCSASDSMMVIALSSTPVSITASGNTTFCQGDSVVLHASPGLANYQWYRWNTPISGANTQNYSAKNRGRYKCIGVNASLCSDTSNTILVSVPCISVGPNHERIDEFFESKREVIHVFPNPTSGVFFIDAPPGLLQVLNSFGQLVDKFTIGESGKTLDLSLLPDGIYFLKLNTEFSSLDYQNSIKSLR